jgi:formylglycine-generating enzyme required for sulfatase activity
VAQLACNELGLYDMSGNVNEWTEIVPDVNSMAYYRGGDVDHVVDWCEISFRGTRDINTYFNHIGFRLAL